MKLLMYNMGDMSIEVSIKQIQNLSELIDKTFPEEKYIIVPHRNQTGYIEILDAPDDPILKFNGEEYDIADIIKILITLDEEKRGNFND